MGAWREPLATVGVALIALLAAAWVLRLWNADLGAPFRYTQLDDTKFYLMLIRSVIRHGWFGAGSSLGAPFGQQLADFPQGADNLNFLLIRGLTVFSSNPATVADLFFLLTFPLVAVSAFLVMRKLAVSRGPATVAAVLFALLPYHFYRGQSQLLLSAYYSVPLSAYLFISVFIGESRFLRRTGSHRRVTSWLSWRSVSTVLLCAVIASAGLYYAVFGLVLLSAAALVALIAKRGRRAIADALGCVLAIGVVLGINLAPSFIYRAEHGSNPAIVRHLGETELLALKPAQLLLPVQGHRLPFLNSVNNEYGKESSAAYCEQCYETLGTVGDIGFLYLIAGGLAALLGAGAILARSRLYPAASLGVFLTLLIATAGGFASLFAYFVTADIRAWNRMSLFIAFFSLMAAALLLQAGVARLGRWRSAIPWALLATVVVLVLGILDETGEDFVPGYRSARAEYNSDGAFFGQVERRIGAGASVFELPYVPFPEGYGASTTASGFASPNLGTTYENARGYITSKSLRWSWGGIKGRATDWGSELAAKPLSVAVAAAALSGFQGLVIEPSAYPVAPSSLMKQLTAQLGQAPLLSRDGAFWFFDLRPYTARLHQTLGTTRAQQVRDATLHAPRVNCSRAGLTLTGGSPSRPVPATFSATLSGVEPLQGPLRVRFPDGSQQAFPAPITNTPISERVVLAGRPGAIRFALPGPIPPAYTLQVTAATLTPQAFEPLAAISSSQIMAGYPSPPCQVHPESTPPSPGRAR
jgi:phosphoglycerol transferase